MQTLEAIHARRDVRAFDDRPIADADLDTILEAGRRSPSSQNQQRWGFVAVAELGTGSAHAAVADHDLARELLDLPEDRTLAYMIPLGYPADGALEPVDRPDRRAFDDVVHRERW